MRARAGSDSLARHLPLQPRRPRMKGWHRNGRYGREQPKKPNGVRPTRFNSHRWRPFHLRTGHVLLSAIMYP